MRALRYTPRRENKIKHQKEALIFAFKGFYEQKAYELGLNENSLLKANPMTILDRGYAKIEQEGKAILSCNQVDFETNLQVRFKDGSVEAKPIKK